MAASGIFLTWLGNEVQVYYDGSRVVTKVDGVIVSYFTPAGEPSSITLLEQPWGQWRLIYTTSGANPATINLHSDNRGATWYS